MAELFALCACVLATVLLTDEAAAGGNTNSEIAVQTLSWDNFTLTQQGEWMIEL